MIDKEPTLARVLAQQVFDNCLVAAGSMDDSHSMLPRLNDILMCVVKGAKDGTVASVLPVAEPIASTSSSETDSSEGESIELGSGDQAAEDAWCMRLTDSTLHIADPPVH